MPLALAAPDLLSDRMAPGLQVLAPSHDGRFVVGAGTEVRIWHFNGSVAAIVDGPFDGPTRRVLVARSETAVEGGRWPSRARRGGCDATTAANSRPRAATCDSSPAPTRFGATAPAAARSPAAGSRSPGTTACPGDSPSLSQVDHKAASSLATTARITAMRASYL